MIRNATIRRLLVAAAFVLPAGLAAAPPVAKVAPVTDDYYGTKVTDPYRWMESGKDPDWMPWLKAQADHTRGVLDTLPGRAQLLADISARTGALPAVSVARGAGPYIFIQERPAGAQDFRLVVREGKGPARTLYEPGAGEGAMVIDGWTPSPDGRHVALQLSKRGTERSIIHVIETATGKMGLERISDGMAVSWLPDGSGFAYLNHVGEHGTPSYYVGNLAKLHMLGASGPDRTFGIRQAKSVAITPNQWNFVLFGRNSESVMLGVRDGRSEYAIYRADLAQLRAGEPRWTRVADFSDTIVDSHWAGDDLYLVSRKGSSNGRVLRTSASKPDLARAAMLQIPGSPVIERVSAARSGAWVSTLEGGVHGLWFVPRQGAPRRVALPYAGTLNWLENDPAKDDALIQLAGWFTPGKVFHLADNGDVHDMGLLPPLPFDTSGYETRQLTATAKDGTKVPYTIVARKGLQATGRTPVLLEAYGSYGMAQTPRFRASVLPFLDRGGAYVIANVRGGGEFGRDWHYAGKAETKANTWRDAIAVAEDLVRTKLTSPGQMTLLGTSAGGVMVGGAVNERPDLFSGAIANVAFMNPVRYVSEQNFADIEEWGGPITDAKSFKTMFALDPYQHIKPGTKYPATLVVSGINDPRAATFHSAKYAARLQAASTSGEPVLLRIDFDAGHGMGSSRSQLDAQWADMLSFVLWQAGVPDFQPRR
jgi:prolyl oligopeptidase